MSATSSPIAVVTTGDVPISVTGTLFRHRGSLHLTVIVKARFTYTPDAPVTVLPAPRIVLRDRHHGRSASRSVVAASDLAPLLPRAQVTLFGHAYAPPGERVLNGEVRLVVGRKGPLLDKTLVVSGEVVDGARTPYQKMPVAYERAAFSDDNPVGIRAERGAPSLIDPLNPLSPAGFGPISRYWPARRDLLGAMDRGELERSIPAFPEDFDWSYFQTAPVDQRLDALVGDEWIQIEGMHPALPSVRFELPSAAAAARLMIAGSAMSALDLVLDTLVIDADLQTFDLAFRGSAPLDLEESELGRVSVIAGVALPGVPLTWPRARDASSGEAVESSAHARTQAMSDERVEALRRLPIAPFPVTAPGAQVGSVAAPIPGAPWARPPAAPRFNAPPLEALVDRAVTDGSGADIEPHEVTITSMEVPFTLPFTTPDLPDAEPPVLDAIPARVRPAIPVVNLSRTSAFTVPWQVRPPQDSLTLVVKGTFDLVEGGAAALREESELPMGEVHLGNPQASSVSYPSDFAVFKPRADVTLTGTAHAPSGSAPFMAVRFRLGSEENGFDRRLVVFGERRWIPGLLGDSASAPAPFTALPLVYERAFGGPDVESNPVGTGHSSVAVRGESALLPNLEDPSHLIMRHAETPRPVGFAPIPAAWKERRSKLGTYDGRWLRTRWPYFPEDFDWGYFQAAPAAQQLGYLRGDEPFEIAGVHEGKPSLRGTLPGLRMRGFAQRTAAAGGQIVEVPLHLDTVHFDTDAGTVSLVWRGIIEVSDEEAPELAAFLVLDEALGDAPIAADEAQIRLLAALTPLDVVTTDPAVDAAPANDQAPSAAPDPQDPEEIAAMARLEALLVAQDQTRIEILRKAGLTEAEINSPPPEPPPPDLKAIGDSLRLNGASEEEIAGFFAAMDPDPEPGEERESASARARARALRLLEDKASWDGEDFADVDLSGLDFSGASLDGALFDGADLHGCRFNGASLQGTQLGRANLARAIFDGANLAGADLTSAKLTGASFASAILEGANFSEVSAIDTVFRGATGDSPMFAGGDFTRADFTEANLPSADFTAATIDGALFARMIAPELAIFDVVGRDAVFNDAQIPRARAVGAKLTGGSLRRLVAPLSVWEGATLDSSTFFGAELGGATFNRASCAGTVFSAADLASANFLRARLGGAQFLKANAMAASFRGADLTKADLRGSNLHGADTFGSTTVGADFELAIVTQSLLTGDR